MLTTTPQYQRCGLTGTIERYSVLVVGDRITVVDDTGVVTDGTVADLGAFVRDAADLRLGWGVRPSDYEVLYLYDRANRNFGFALNLTLECCSEWLYAPFPCEQCEARAAKGGDA